MTWTVAAGVRHKLHHVNTTRVGVGNVYLIMCNGVRVYYDEKLSVFQENGVPTCLKCLPLGNA